MASYECEINNELAEELEIEEHNEEEIDLTAEDNSINLEDIDVDEIDELEEFGDIEDLDAIEDIDEFAEIKDEVQNVTQEVKEEYLPEDDTGFNDDYQRFSLIQDAIRDYYKDDRYNSKFIENIYIADSIGVSSDLKRYLEEEMFLNVYIRQIDLSAEVCDMAKAELI